jgi:hypothetical protein
MMISVISSLSILIASVVLILVVILLIYKLRFTILLTE